MNPIKNGSITPIQKAHLLFSKQVEKKIKDSKNKYHARASMWVAKLNREYLGGAS